MADDIGIDRQASGDAFDDPEFLPRLRDQMLTFALQQLNDRHTAEDAVQEAFVGALRNRASFARAAAFRTWVFAILRNKIADALRSRYRQRERELPAPFDEDAALADERFEPGGEWRSSHRPQRWSDPEGMTEDAQFWRIFEACLERLSGRTARIFMMREFIGLEIAEICATLGMTASSVSVTLFRARAGLRDCLESQWFKR